MIFTVLLLLLASVAAFAASVNDTVPTPRCLSHRNQTEMDAAETNFRQILSTRNFAVDTRTAASPPISIVWHVIQRSDDYYDGNVPDSQIQGTVDALNGQFGSSGISFTLTKTTRTTNADWFSGAGGSDPSLETAMKTQLHEGDVTTLNVYTVGFEFDKELCGIHTFPWEYPDNRLNDGIMVVYNSLLGGTRRYFDEGKVFTHEVGHWLGLWDVWQGGCNGDGDQVHDTNPQRVPTIGCPWRQKSCLFKKGWDNIHNFMDASYDRCQHEFTDGQITRIKEQILAYRGIQVG